MNYCAKHKELTVFTNKVSKLLDQKGRLTFLLFNVYVKNNSLAKILSFKKCEKYSRSARDYGYINIEGCKNDYERWNGFQVQIVWVRVILL